MPAGALQPGDLFRSRDGQYVEVEKLEDRGEETEVYNLHVADYHTYFVGCQEWGFSVWAHNAACTPEDIKAIAKDISDADANLAAEMINRGGGNRDAAQQFLEYNGASREEVASLLNRFGMHEETPAMPGMPTGAIPDYADGHINPWRFHTEFKDPRSMGVMGFRPLRTGFSTGEFDEWEQRNLISRRGSMRSM